MELIWLVVVLIIALLSSKLLDWMVQYRYEFLVLYAVFILFLTALVCSHFSTNMGLSALVYALASFGSWKRFYSHMRRTGEFRDKSRDFQGF